MNSIDDRDILSEKKKWYQRKDVVAHYDEDRFSDALGRYRNDLEARILRGRLSGNLLDAGCGTGRLCFRIQEMGGQITRYTFFDSSSAMLDMARKEAGRRGIENVDFHLGDLLSMDYPDEYFDCAICFHTLIHVPQYVEVVKELLRVVKPGGSVIAQMYARPFKKSKMNPKSALDSYTFVSPREFRCNFDCADLEKIEIIPFDVPNKLTAIIPKKLLNALLAPVPIFQATQHLDRVAGRFLPTAFTSMYMAVLRKRVLR